VAAEQEGQRPQIERPALALAGRSNGELNSSSHSSEAGPTKGLLRGFADDSGALFATFDRASHHVQPQLGTSRFAAFLAPYPSEEAARRALLEAGAVLE
jgi:hypothetical protein